MLVIAGTLLHYVTNFIHSSVLLFISFIACMLLEDSAVGREVWRESCRSFLSKVSDLFRVVLKQESLRDGQLCYITVKVHKGSCIHYNLTL